MPVSRRLVAVVVADVVGYSRLLLYQNDFTVDRECVLSEADADSLRAVTLDALNALAWTIRGSVLGARGYLDVAFAANDRALELDPSRFYPVMKRGWLYLAAGKYADALKVVESLRIPLAADSGPRLLACTTHLELGAYDQAIAECERAGANAWLAFANLTAAYALAGEMDKAERAKRSLLQVRPDFTIARYEAKRFLNAPAMIEQQRTGFIAGLRKASIP